MSHLWRKDLADDNWHCLADDEACCGVVGEWDGEEERESLKMGDGGKICKTCFDHWLNLD